MWCFCVWNRVKSSLSRKRKLFHFFFCHFLAQILEVSPGRKHFLMNTEFELAEVFLSKTFLLKKKGEIFENIWEKKWEYLWVCWQTFISVCIKRFASYCRRFAPILWVNAKKCFTNKCQIPCPKSQSLTSAVVVSMREHFLECLIYFPSIVFSSFAFPWGSLFKFYLFCIKKSLFLITVQLLPEYKCISVPYNYEVLFHL